jgi:hypothetical protein
MKLIPEEFRKIYLNRRLLEMPDEKNERREEIPD